MHQIRLRLGLCPRPCWGSLQCSPDSLAGFEGLLLRGEGTRGEGGERTGEEAFLVMWPTRLSVLNPPWSGKTYPALRDVNNIDVI